MLYNSANPYEGGPSFEASPKYLENIDGIFWWRWTLLTNHDKCVLDIFNRTPTFDPSLMAQRQYIERFRPVGDRHFYVSASISMEVVDHRYEGAPIGTVSCECRH